MSHSPKNLLPILVVLGAVCGGLAGYRAGVCLPKAPAEIDQQLYSEADWAMTRDGQHPLDVTPAKWQPFPYLLADFDLQLDVELAADTDFDLMLRRVEPRPVQGERLQFDGRFVVLRLSSHADGEVWRSREQALFGPLGGERIDAGYPATVLVQGRGRQLRAQIAGHPWTPWFLAADEHGSFAVASHGGLSRVHAFKIVNLGQPSHWPVWPISALLGAVLAALGFAFGLCRKELGASLLLWPIGTEVARRLALYDLLPLARPETASLWWLVAAGLPLTLAFWAPRGRWWLSLPLAVVAFLGAVALPARIELPRRAHGQSPLVDLVFGTDAGEGLAEALACRIRGPEPAGLHILEPKQARVMLLGGQLLYGLRGNPDEHLELQLYGDVRREHGKEAEVISLPTIDGWSLQQWLLFATFYRDFEPQVLVFGVPAAEAAVESVDVDVAGVRRALSEGPQRSLRDQKEVQPLIRPKGVEGVMGWFHQLWPLTVSEPRSNEARLLHTLAAVTAYAAKSGCKLVLLADAGLPTELRELVRKTAKEAAASLVELSGNDLPADVSKKLSDAVLPLLR